MLHGHVILMLRNPDQKFHLHPRIRSIINRKKKTKVEIILKSRKFPSLLHYILSNLEQLSDNLLKWTEESSKQILSRGMRESVFSVSDQVRHKSG